MCPSAHSPQIRLLQNGHTSHFVALFAVRLVFAANVATGSKILQFPSPAALLATEGFFGCMFLIYRRSLPFQCERTIMYWLGVIVKIAEFAADTLQLVYFSPFCSIVGHEIIDSKMYQPSKHTKTFMYFIAQVRGIACSLGTFLSPGSRCSWCYLPCLEYDTDS